MNRSWLAVGCVLLLSGQLAAQDRGGKIEPKTTKQKASYSIGLNLGMNLKRGAVDLDVDMLAQGIRDALSGGKTLLSEAEAEKAMAAFEKEVMAKQKARDQAASAQNQKKGDAFLAENKTKQDVKTTKSGLQYKILKQGKGPRPKLGDSVTTHYKGTLLDGKEFDSSYARKEPATFPVRGVIPGWTEALQLMTVGSKWQLFVPSELAYGKASAGPDIGPNSTLIFEVELLDIAKSKPEQLDLPELDPPQ